jgi:Flp pilus assembly protein TadG
MTRQTSWWWRRGVAGLEFALCAPLLLLMLAALSDLGLALRSKLLLASGVANAASYAILTQGTASATSLASIVKSASTLSGVQVPPPPAPACFCPNGSPVSLKAATCGSTCANGAQAGTYVSISATYTYVPLMPGYAFVANTTLSESAWVQVK